MLAIHIGLPKSGSATIQNFLYTNEVALRALSIDYVQIGRVTEGKPFERRSAAHHNFTNELKRRVKVYKPERGSVAGLADYVAASPYRTSIVSSEMFENCSTEQVAGFAKTLSSIGQDIRIVMILRDFADLVPSSYAQKVRSGLHTYDFDTFFASRIQEERANYFETAAKWGKAFGWANMRVRLLDRDHLVNGDLIDDFLCSIDVDIADPAIRALPREQRVNEANGWKTLEATRALFAGKHGLPQDHPLVSFMEQSSRANDDEGPQRGYHKRFEKAAVTVAERNGWKDKGRYLSREQAQQCLDIYRQSLDGFNRHLADPLPPGVDLDVRGFVARDFMPDASRIPPDELRGFYDEAWAELARQHPGLLEEMRKRTRGAKRRAPVEPVPPPSERDEKRAAKRAAKRSMPKAERQQRKAARLRMAETGSAGDEGDRG